MNIDIENITSVYYYIAVFSTLVFVIKTLIFSFTGGDAEVFTDFTTEFEAETSFDFLSTNQFLHSLWDLAGLDLQVSNNGTCHWF